MAFTVLSLAFFAAASGVASAHPLGNFTTNRYARVEVGASLVRVHYVLDEAELVAFRSRAAVAADAAAVATDRLMTIASSLSLSIDGQPVALRSVSQRLTTPPGQGGLTTLRLEAVLEGALPEGLPDGRRVEAAFADANGPDLIGWREIVVRGVDGTRVEASSVPSVDASDALRSYPSDPSVRPLDVRAATFSFVPSASGIDTPRALADEGTGAARTGDRFVGLVTDTASSPLAIGSALLVALLVGAAHALGPGHGKTVMAAYLVSTSGRRRDAVALGVVVSLMHTVSVLVLAGLLATVGRNLDAHRVYPVLTLVAGALVVAVGLRLVRSRLAARPVPVTARVADQRVLAGVGARTMDAAPHDHEHDHDHHDDVHDHGAGVHTHGGRSHSHELPTDVRPLSRAGLLALGTSGGLFPSPSAVVVLVGAFVAGRAALGLALIAAFSIGLAAVLVAVGLLLVAGRDRLRASRFAGALPWLPSLGAAAIVALGLVLVLQGLMQLG